MSQKLMEMKQKRAGLIYQARQILDDAEAQKRELTSEEQTRWDALIGQADGLQKTVETEERQLALEAQLATSDGRSLRTELNDTPGVDKRTNPLATDEYRAAFRQALIGGTGSLNRQQADILANALRSLQADNNVSGGYLYAPMSLAQSLIKAVDNAVYLRQWATPNPVTTSESLGVPTLEADPSDADWTSELAIGNEDSDMSFGRRELKPHPLAKLIKVSNKLLMKSPDAEGLVVSRLGYKFGITMEKAMMTGSGAGQPLGIFTASSNGISTGRDVATDNTTTAVTFDGLINAKYALKGQYWGRAKWLAHRDFYKMVSKLKTGDGQYIWRESVRVGEPDMLLGIPAYASEYAPNTFTTGLYVAMLGDYSFVHTADSMAFVIQRLVELYAATNQIGLIGRLESDAMPVLEEAFVRVKLA